jgi:hypothetical protein
MQVDWAEMPTRPRIWGRERRVYPLICSLPFSGAATAHFSLDMTIESFLQGHVRAFDWLGGVPRELVYDNLRSAVARRDGDRITWNPRFVQLRGHYAFHATACTPATPRERARSRARSATTRPASGRPAGSPRLRSSTTSTLAGATASRCRAGTRRAGSSSPSAWRSSARRCGCCRPSLSTRPVAAARAFRSMATSSTRAASTARRSGWFISALSCVGTATWSGSSIAARPSRATRAAS